MVLRLQARFPSYSPCSSPHPYITYMNWSGNAATFSQLAFSYIGAAFENVSTLSHESEDTHLLIEAGRLRMIAGGCLLGVLM